MPQLDFNLVFNDFLFLISFFIIFYLFFYFYFLRRVFSGIVTRRIIRDRLEILAETRQNSYKGVEGSLNNNLIYVLSFRESCE